MLGGLGINILSTSQGVMTGKQARRVKSRRRSAVQRLLSTWRVRALVGCDRPSALCTRRERAMSRVGKKLIEIPKDVKVKITDSVVEVQGPKGKLTTPDTHRESLSSSKTAS